jgi:aspartate aminotransferase
MKTADRVSKVRPSPTLAIDAKAKALKAQGVDVVGFGAGEPDFDTPANIKDVAIKAINSGYTKYCPVEGTPELKDAIINRFKTDHGVEYKRSEIIVSCGAKHSLYNLFMAMFNDGDEVIIPAPYWVSYPDMALLAGAKPVIVKTSEVNGFKMTADDFKKAITNRTRAVVMNNPSNPTGAAYTKAELLPIAEVAVEKKIPIISDEIYDKLVYDGFKFTSTAALGKEVRDITLLVNGVSKSYAMTGWRIGYLAGNEEVVAAMSKIQSQSTSNPTSICLKATVEALSGPQDSVAMMRKEFEARRNWIVDALNAIPGITCRKPEGAFYVFPNISGLFGKSWAKGKITGSGDFAEYLLEDMKVALVPGSAFGDDNYARLSYATSMETIKKGIERIGEAVKKL